MMQFYGMINPTKQPRLIRLAMVALRVEAGIDKNEYRVWHPKSVAARYRTLERKDELYLLHSRLIDEILHLLAPGFDTEYDRMSAEYVRIGAMMVDPKEKH